MTWPQISKSFFPRRYHLTTLERQFIYLKCFATMSLWPSKDLSTRLSPDFPGAVSSLNLLGASCLFREYLKSIQLQSCVKSAFHYFYCFNGFKSVTMVMCQMGMWLNLVATPVLAQPCWMSHHDIKLYNPLIAHSTQGILLLLNIYYFRLNILKKSIFKGLFEKKKGHIVRKL